MRWNGASYRDLVGMPMETEKTTWSEFPNGGKAIVEQILVSEERKKSKRAGLWESKRGSIWVIECMSCRDADQSRLVKLFGLSPNMKMQ